MKSHYVGIESNDEDIGRVVEALGPRLNETDPLSRTHCGRHGPR